METYACILVFCITCGVSLCDYPFRNISLSWEERVNDLVGRLTLEEIVLQMAKALPAPAIERLGIEPKGWDTECLRGDVFSTSTSFPQALGLAATFSPSLIFRIAEAVAVEVRAQQNNKYHTGQSGLFSGLSCFSPVINIMRHPLWGRNQETYGEDPYMNGLYSQHFVAGLQGDHPRYVRANAGCKHFDVHGGPENIPVSRFSFDSQVSTRDWRLTFLPAFRMCVEAGTYSIMCSFNSINGVPACGNKQLLTDILRVEMGFTGYVVSDMGAAERIVEAHHYNNNSVDGVSTAVNAGCNLDLTLQKKEIFMNLGKAVQEGKVTIDTVMERIKPLFYTRMRLGEFDPPEMNPYTKINITAVESEAHIVLAREAAVESFVLLKNHDKFLPLKYPSSFGKVAIVGPMANNASQLFGDYAPKTDPQYISTPYTALKSLWHSVNFASGCSFTSCDDYNTDAIESAVTGSDLVFVCLGTGQAIESEGNDRADMNLPGSQLQLLQDAVQFANGSAVVLLMFNAGPLDIAWADEHDVVTSILACFFPAQETGNALLQVLLGEESPAGRMPYTWYKSLDQTPPITNYTMVERTYRYFTGEPLYPFGYGLSYSTFRYLNLTIEHPTLKVGQDQVVWVTVSNIGQTISDEVVQVYISWVNARTKMPNLQLVAFDRLRALSPTEASVTVKFTIEFRQLAQWDDAKNQYFVQAGTIQVYTGGQQPNQARSVNSNVLMEKFEVLGET